MFTAETTGDEVVKTFAAEAHGKTVLITGPSEGGIGAQTAIFLAAGKPKLIILAGRSIAKIQPVIDEIKTKDPDVKVTFVQVDLADISSVRTAASTVNSQVEKLDVLINNAGIMALKNYTASPDGIEMQFAANHTGHFLLTNLLMDEILAAGAGARIINVSSFGYLAGGIRFDDWNFKDGARYNPWLAYAQSKTANILLAQSLAKKLERKGVLAFSLNPGLILETKLQAEVTQEMFADGYATTVEALNGDPLPVAALNPRSLAAGAATSLYAALDPSLQAHSGAFLSAAQVWTEKLRPQISEENAEKLWTLSEDLVGQKFLYS